VNRLFGLILVVLIILGGLWFINNSRSIKTPSLNPKAQPGPSIGQADEKSKGEAVSVFAKNLEVPWAIAFLPDGRLLVTERAGRVRLVENDGTLQSQPVITISEVKQTGESGLHGIALHPDFSTKPFVYLYYTYSSSGNNSLNKVVRYSFLNNQLTEPKIIIEGIPGAIFHDGGRVKFGPDEQSSLSDKNLYITTGDAQNPSLSQDTSSLAGKILRVTDEGQPVSGNPFNSPVYSYGHRNPQGIAWDSNGQLWETEHGPSGGGLGTGNDEFNKIEVGKNYGWPEIQGDQTKTGMTPPILHSGTDTWAPAGLAFFRNSFFFGGLRGEALYQVKFEGGPKLVTHFKGEFGRIREVILGPDNMLYITTSNKDGRGDPQADDDKILRVNPEKL